MSALPAAGSRLAPAKLAGLPTETNYSRESHPLSCTENSFFKESHGDSEDGKNLHKAAQIPWNDRELHVMCTCELRLLGI